MNDLFTVQYSWLIPLLPLIGACLSGFFGARWLKGQSHWPIWLGVGASAVLSFMLLAGMVNLWDTGPGIEPHGDPGQIVKPVTAEEAHPTLSITSHWYEWASIGDPAKAGTKSYLKVDAGAFFDPLTAVMLCVVTGIGFFITVFAKGYMAGESGYFRFFAYLGLFIFSMTILVMGENLILLYLGWEGVGLCSYLLIGYYYEKPSAREAAKKAFIANRVGDFGFGIGIMLCFLVFGTVSFYGGDPSKALGVLTKAADQGFYNALQPWQQDCIYWVPFCLMLGAFGKSAQFPLYVWLPDAMEGPTPVSALIHAATMVTAGVYMIVRCSTLFYQNSAAIMTIAAVGCFTALLAATIALRQFDLKKVFAYSTISQLGFMFVGVGVLAPVAGVFHLVTHAFFKALLFLSSGVVMHAMGGELDMRKMSGVKKVLPITFWCILAGCLALAGFPGTSGFFSKDDIVGAALHRYPLIGIILLITAFMTAYYTFRLFFRVFLGPLVVPEPQPGHGGHDDHGAHDDHGGHGADSHGHDNHAHHNHEPLSMILPLIVLAIGAIGAGYLNFPERTHSLSGFLAQSPSIVLGYDVAVHGHGDMGRVHASYFGFEEEGAPSQTFGMILGGVISIAGILLAWYLHLANRTLAEQMAASKESLLSAVRDLIDHKFYVDEIYQACIIEPLRTLGKILFFIDSKLVDFIVESFGWIPQLFGYGLRFTVQRGYLQGYATAMLFGVLVVLALIFLRS
jgi:NADH-quinone oxidoreductase subunit L